MGRGNGVPACGVRWGNSTDATHGTYGRNETIAPIKVLTRNGPTDMRHISLIGPMSPICGIAARVPNPGARPTPIREFPANLVFRLRDRVLA
jgi:hypothetical protein